MPSRILDPEAVVQRSEDGLKPNYKPLTEKDAPEGKINTRAFLFIVILIQFCLHIE